MKYLREIKQGKAIKETTKEQNQKTIAGIQTKGLRDIFEGSIREGYSFFDEISPKAVATFVEALNRVDCLTYQDFSDLKVKHLGKGVPVGVRPLQFPEDGFKRANTDILTPHTTLFHPVTEDAGHKQTTGSGEVIADPHQSRHEWRSAASKA